MPRGDQVFPYFFAVWIALGALGFYFFFLNKDAAFKRKYFPWFAVSASALFLVFMWLMGFPPQTFVLMVPAAVLITVLNIRGTRFCSSCGRTIFSQGMPWSRPDYCSSCGAKLDGR